MDDSCLRTCGRPVEDHRSRTFEDELGAGKEIMLFYTLDSIGITLKIKLIADGKKLADELACGKIASMHLCGDATRHFPVIKEELGCLHGVSGGLLVAQAGPGGGGVDLRRGARRDTEGRSSGTNPR